MIRDLVADRLRLAKIMKVLMVLAFTSAGIAIIGIGMGSIILTNICSFAFVGVFLVIFTLVFLETVTRED